MYLTDKIALEKLLEILKSKPGREIRSVLEAYEAFCENYDREIILSRQMPLRAYYALEKLVRIKDNADRVSTYVEEVIKVDVTDLQALCKARGLKYAKVLEVVEGKTKEYESYRQRLDPNSRNIPYKTPIDPYDVEPIEPRRPNRVPSAQIKPPTFTDFGVSR